MTPHEHHDELRFLAFVLAAILLALVSRASWQ